MTPLLQAAACLCGLIIAGLAALQPEPPTYVIRSIDRLGQEFIAGSGDSCREAWHNAVQPENVALTICIKSN